MKKIVVSLLVVGVVAAVVLVGSIALFTSTKTNPTNSFTAGTVVLTIDKPATAMFTVPNMAPGDIVYAGLQVDNSGTLPLRYAMTTTPGGNVSFAAQLQLTVAVVTDAGNDTEWGTADDVVGSTIYATGPLSDGYFGDIAQGNQPGDRTLAASGSEHLLFTVTLPIGTGNEAQGQNCTADFVFNAEQTTNNP